MEPNTATQKYKERIDIMKGEHNGNEARNTWEDSSKNFMSRFYFLLIKVIFLFEN